MSATRGWAVASEVKTPSKLEGVPVVAKRQRKQLFSPDWKEPSVKGDRNKQDFVVFAERWSRSQKIQSLV